MAPLQGEGPFASSAARLTFHPPSQDLSADLSAEASAKAEATAVKPWRNATRVPADVSAEALMGATAVKPWGSTINGARNQWLG